MKRCTHCHVEKPSDAYPNDVIGQCGECTTRRKEQRKAKKARVSVTSSPEDGNQHEEPNQVDTQLLVVRSCCETQLRSQLQAERQLSAKQAEEIERLTCEVDRLRCEVDRLTHGTAPGEPPAAYQLGLGLVCEDVNVDLFGFDNIDIPPCALSVSSNLDGDASGKSTAKSGSGSGSGSIPEHARDDTYEEHPGSHFDHDAGALEDARCLRRLSDIQSGACYLAGFMVFAAVFDAWLSPSNTGEMFMPEEPLYAVKKSLLFTSGCILGVTIWKYAHTQYTADLPRMSDIEFYTDGIVMLMFTMWLGHLLLNTHASQFTSDEPSALPVSTLIALFWMRTLIVKVLLDLPAWYLTVMSVVPIIGIISTPRGQTELAQMQRIFVPHMVALLATVHWLHRSRSRT